ncbi:MAG TPA: VCBS repeat-containing protein, partial [Myxococcota bacterium]|nr:VCBS repeat-containing protein [Myxococcota bacterium]
LSSSWGNGGEVTQLTVHSPSLTVADVDGDGWQDLLHPSHSHLKVWFGGPAVGSRAALLNLPFDLEPRDVPPKEGEVRREITGVWFKDINGDKRVDLAVQRLVMDGSFFGATSELVFCQGNGSGFAAPVVLSTASAAFGVALEDFDGDGDQDWIVPEVDVGFANLARALVSRVVRVNLRLYRYASGFSSGVSLRELSYPLGTSGKFQATYDGDVNGDGRRDLVTNEGEDRVRVFAGTAEGLSSAAILDQELRVPVGNDTLFVHDLTGDKAAEILVWGPNEATATLIRLP